MTHLPLVALVVGVLLSALLVGSRPDRPPAGGRRPTVRSPVRSPLRSPVRGSVRRAPIGRPSRPSSTAGDRLAHAGDRLAHAGDRLATAGDRLPHAGGGSRPGRAWPRPGLGQTGERGARWATARDLGVLRWRGPEVGRLVLGRTTGRRPLGRPRVGAPQQGITGRRRRTGRRPGAGGGVLAAEFAQSVAVVGPTQSGKTTAIAVPAILGWDGPVLAASVKTDLVRDTVEWRRRCGRVWCFDPGGSTGLPSHCWSPLPAAKSWAGARRVAADLTEVARGEGTTADGEFWYATAAKLLAPLLFAAATGGRTMADVVRWVDTQDMEEVADLLEAAGVPEAVQAARASWQREERQRSSVYTTAETVLEPFADQTSGGGSGDANSGGSAAGNGSAAGSGGGSGGGIDPAELLQGSNTLYLCAPAHDQRRLRPLFSALVKQVLETAFGRAAEQGAPLSPPLLVVLDEAANIAPLAELDGLAATCAGHGVQLVTVWQDLAQVSARYGGRAPTVINNHRAKVFLSGIADPGTLDHASHLVGDEELLVPSFTRDATGGRSTTATPLQRRLLPPDALRRLAPGTGVLVYGALPPVRMRLRPWWDDPALAARGGASTGR